MNWLWLGQACRGRPRQTYPDLIEDDNKQA